MNELEKYKNKIGEDVVDKTTLYGAKKSEIGSSQRSYWENQFLGFQQGFDAVILLELPVLFSEWVSWNYVQVNINVWGKGTEWFNTKELYQYWIDNVYEPNQKQ